MTELVFRLGDSTYLFRANSDCVPEIGDLVAARKGEIATGVVYVVTGRKMYVCTDAGTVDSWAIYVRELSSTEFRLRCGGMTK